MPLLDKLLKERPKTAAETITKVIDSLNALEVGASGERQKLAVDTAAKHLLFLKVFLFGDEEHEVTRESVLEIVKTVVHTDLLYLMVKHLALLPFEARKDAAQVFGAAVRIHEENERAPGAIYVQQRPYIVTKLFSGYDDPSIALNCGAMLRDCVRDETLAARLLESDTFLNFFEAVDVANFEIASDVFSTFKDLLTRHKLVVSQYLNEHYKEFFTEYMALLKSSNYVTRRQSLKLLGELLLDRSNVKVMVRFVSDVQHLIQMMVLLKDSSRSIQFEAFHVFKVFVANPNKPQPIIDILTNNKEKLLRYLEDFHSERDEGDEMFKEEKAVLIREISMLGVPPRSHTPPPPRRSPTPPPSGSPKEQDRQ